MLQHCLLLCSAPDSEPVVIAPAAPVTSISSTHTMASVTCTCKGARHPQLSSEGLLLSDPPAAACTVATAAEALPAPKAPLSRCCYFCATASLTDAHHLPAAGTSAPSNLQTLTPNCLLMPQPQPQCALCCCLPGRQQLRMRLAHLLA